MTDTDTVYAICWYDEDRTLRGFTRPVKRISGQLRQLGEIAQTAVPVLVTQYEPGEMQASCFSCFSVDPLVVPLINEMAGGRRGVIRQRVPLAVRCHPISR
ncbi:hypothetical protein [Streptomyces mexicanus]|uniref:hypothetical protein n=1 Tax=Streptomyces mexicanus TaxID=178566 RepID=UPI0031E94B30